MTADHVDPIIDPTAPPVKRKRGRKRKAGTMVVNVRLRVTDYDNYCRVAIRAQIPVRSVLRHVLTLHAPKTAQ